MDPALLLNSALINGCGKEASHPPGSGGGSRIENLAERGVGEEILSVLAQPGKEMSPLLLTTTDKKEYK